MTKYTNRVRDVSVDAKIIVVALLVTCQVARGAFAVRYSSTHHDSSRCSFDGQLTWNCNSIVSKSTRHQLASLSSTSSLAILQKETKGQQYKYRTRYHDTSGLSVRGGSAISVGATTTGAAAISIDDIPSSTTLNDKDALKLLPKTMPPLPTLGQYRKFAIPCLALWVAGPLLSLVDTTFVGLSGSASQSAQQLAALGPATTLYVKFLLFYFIF
jgi:hypothetical protein